MTFNNTDLNFNNDALDPIPEQEKFSILILKRS
jgi:hypothetical protein